MADEISINTAQVGQTSVGIQRENTTLSDTLEKTQESVNNLRQSWQSPSADSIIPIFYAFACKHFPNTHDTVNRYAEFLKNNIAQGYDETETANSLIADEFK